jgi:hypothetical protein
MTCYFRLVCSTADCPASREGGAHLLLVAEGGGATGLLMMRTSRFMALRRLRMTLCQVSVQLVHSPLLCCLLFLLHIQSDTFVVAHLCVAAQARTVGDSARVCCHHVVVPGTTLAGA